jgi:hypothetical protein
VIIPRAWTIFVEIFVQVPQRTMIGTVLTSAVETLLMSTTVGLGQISVNSPVGPAIVLIVVCESWRQGCGQQQNRCRRKGFSDCHGCVSFA